MGNDIIPTLWSVTTNVPESPHCLFTHMVMRRTQQLDEDWNSTYRRGITEYVTLLAVEANSFKSEEVGRTSAMVILISYFY